MEKTVNNRIVEVKDSTMLTVKEFCDKAEISMGTYSKIQNNGDVSGKIVARICSNFAISKNWLLTGEGEMKENETVPVELKEDYIAHLKQEVKFYRHLLAQVTGMPAPNFKRGFANAVVKELYPKQRKTVRVEAA